jgi:excisionase family DNA binding protein
MAAKEPKYYTTQQVANFLGVSVPTVVNWVKQGRLDAHRTPGGHRRITPESLSSFARRFSYPLPFETADSTEPTITRVLVVDAEPDFGEVVGEYLQLRAGFKVRVVDNAFEAGLQIGSFQPHLVVLDLEMPALDGMVVARALRDQGADPRVRLLASTAFRDTVPTKRLMAAGVDGIVGKPFRLETLLGTIKKLLG